MFRKDLDVHLTHLGFECLKQYIFHYMFSMLGVKIYCGVGVSSVSGSFIMSTSLSTQITPFFIIIVNYINIYIFLKIKGKLPYYRNISVF